MTETATLEVEVRTKLGTGESRKLRKLGLVPCNVYGHGEGSESVTANEDALRGLVHAGSRVVELQGAKQGGQMTMIREIQWDTFGSRILHVDLIRVDPNEKVVLEVPVETRGTAPGVLSGGHLEIPMHTLTVECSAIQIPSSIEVKVGHLEIEQSVQVSELDLPDGVTVLNEPGTTVVQVVPAVEVLDEELVPTTGEGAEPELVGGEAEAEESDA